MEHVLYETTDPDVPCVVLDRSGHVVPMRCKRCGGAEGALPSKCPGRRMTGAELNAVYSGALDYNGKVWTYPRHGMHEPCCEKEDRGWSGGCRSCGDPCL